MKEVFHVRGNEDPYLEVVIDDMFFTIGKASGATAGSDEEESVTVDHGSWDEALDTVNELLELLTAAKVWLEKKEPEPL